MNLLDLARAALPDRRADHAPTTATPDQAAELRDLIAVILANDSESDRAEALMVALADSDAALISFRALVADLPNAMRAHEDIDDRRPCTDCGSTA